jgi:hypothetical protein
MIARGSHLHRAQKKIKSMIEQTLLSKHVLIAALQPLQEFLGLCAYAQL